MPRILIVEEPNLYTTEDQLQLVLDYCNDKSGFKNSIGLRYNNNTHSISNLDCKWRLLENFPDSNVVCIPFIDQSRLVGEIKNKTHIFDADRCKWKTNPDYDAVNSKGCPQFCPKDKMENEN